MLWPKAAMSFWLEVAAPVTVVRFQEVAKHCSCTSRSSALYAARYMIAEKRRQILKGTKSENISF